CLGVITGLAQSGALKGEGDGAKTMVEQGVLTDHEVEVAFGIHINSQTPIGHVNYKPGGAMRASNSPAKMSFSWHLRLRPFNLTFILMCNPQ
ncbi:MAG: hypothetical protein AAFZ52_05170, partial [Bacteroidota bacterium]